MLDALVRKTEVIRQELGASGEVLRLTMEQTLASGGIRRGEAGKLAAAITAEASPRADVAQRELGDEHARRMMRLKEEEARLQDLKAYRWSASASKAADVRHVVEVALRDNGAALAPGPLQHSAGTAARPPGPGLQERFELAGIVRRTAARTAGGPKERQRWRNATPVRGLIFEPPLLAERHAGTAGRGAVSTWSIGS